MADASLSVPKGVIGAVVFGTADGFEIRGIGALKQIDAALSSLLDMRGGVLDLRGFERDGSPAWAAIPIRAGGHQATLIVQIRPCRDATNRAGIAGAGVALQLSPDELAVPLWRGRVAFALASTLLDRLIVGEGFSARVNLNDWRWPADFKELASIPALEQATQQSRGALNHLTIDVDWARVVNDPAALFIEHLRPRPVGGLGPGLLIEAVEQTGRRRETHLTAVSLANGGDEAVRRLEDRLRDAISRADALDLEGRQQHAELQKAKFAEAARVERTADLEKQIDRLNDDLKTTLQKLSSAEKRAAHATERYNYIARNANKRISKLKERYESGRNRTDWQQAGADQKEAVSAERWRITAPLARLLTEILYDTHLDIAHLAKESNSIQRYIKELEDAAGKGHILDALNWLAESDRNQGFGAPSRPARAEKKDEFLYQEDLDPADDLPQDSMPDRYAGTEGGTPVRSASKNASAHAAAPARPQKPPPNREKAESRSTRNLQRKSNPGRYRDLPSGGGHFANEVSNILIYVLVGLVCMTCVALAILVTKPNTGKLFMPHNQPAQAAQESVATEPPSRDEHSGSVISVLADCNNTNVGRCLEYLRERLNDMTVVVNGLDRGNLTVGSARNAASKIKSISEMYDQLTASDGRREEDVDRLLSEIRQELNPYTNSNLSRTAYLIEIIDLKRRDLESQGAGSEVAEYQEISGNLVAVTDKYGK